MININAVMIGSNPSQKSSSIVPFWHDTRSYKTIQDWRDAVEQEPTLKFNDILFLNVSNQPTPNNRPLKMSEIKAALPMFKDLIGPYVDYNFKVIALGKTAEKALTLLQVPHYAMPHPSGLNRQLNDKKFVEEKIKGLQVFLETL